MGGSNTDKNDDPSGCRRLDFFQSSPPTLTA